MSNPALELFLNRSAYAYEETAESAADEQTDFSPEAVEVPVQVQRNKFVGSSRQSLPAISVMSPWHGVPNDIRHWIEILEIDIADVSAIQVHSAWRKVMASPAVHPDLGGDTDLAVLVTRAKDELLKWVDLQSPKLGKQFSHLAR